MEMREVNVPVGTTGTIDVKVAADVAVDLAISEISHCRGWLEWFHSDYLVYSYSPDHWVQARYLGNPVAIFSRCGKSCCDRGSMANVRPDWLIQHNDHIKSKMQQTHLPSQATFKVGDIDISITCKIDGVELAGCKASSSVRLSCYMYPTI